MDRRLFLSLFAAFPLQPQQSAEPRVRTVATIPLAPPYAGQSATLVELNLPAGQPSGPPHRHPGFVLGYVIEGELRFQVAGEPERVLKAGESFYEPPGTRHLVAASASPTRAARVLAIVIAESGSPITAPL